MSRKFIASALILATTIAGLAAAPARAASEEDIARLVGAAATIFIIGKAIESSRDHRNDKKKDRTEVQHFTPQHPGRHGSNVPTVVPNRDYTPNRNLQLPQRCVRQIDGGHVRRVVMERCLERQGISTHRLPRSCEMTVATQRGHRQAYALPCLRHRGYSIASN